jgi:putative spermidine/putrescine transport system permease protein
VLIFDPAGLGMIWVYAFKGIPFVTLMTLTVMTRINRQYQGVARTLGAGGLQQLLRIYLPLSRRVILWSCLVLFAYALGSFEVPHFMSAFAPRPLAASLYSLYLRPGLTSYYEAMAQGILMLVFGGARRAVYLGLLNRLAEKHPGSSGPGVPALSDGWPPFWLAVLAGLWLIPMGYVLLYSFFAAIPFPELLPRRFSLQFWENTLSRNTLFLPGLLTSVQLAVLTGLITALLGLMAARSLSRMKRSTSLSWFALISLPLFVPAMILMLSLHLLMLRLSLANSKTAVLLAHVIISLPYATAILTAYFKGIGTGMEETAKTLGCTPFHYYRKLLLPLMMPGLFFSFASGFSCPFPNCFPCCCWAAATC